MYFYMEEALPQIQSHMKSEHSWFYVGRADHNLDHFDIWMSDAKIKKISKKISWVLKYKSGLNSESDGTRILFSFLKMPFFVQFLWRKSLPFVKICLFVIATVTLFLINYFHCLSLSIRRKFKVQIYLCYYYYLIFNFFINVFWNEFFSVKCS